MNLLQIKFMGQKHMSLFLTNNMTPTKFLGKQKLAYFIIFIVFLVLSVGASKLTDFNGINAILALPKVVSWMLSNLFPDAKAIERIPKMVDKLGDTVLMAIMSTVIAAVLSFFFSIMGAITTTPNKGISYIVKAIASINRNIPIVAWAMIFLLTFGQSSFTGFLALFFASFGFLTRAFMESIDESASKSVEALKATGSSYFQIIFQAVVPSSLPQLVSWVLYMIELNIRSATLVGLLTGSGIGFIFSLYYKSLQYKSASLLVVMIMFVILLLEFISNKIRRKIL